MQIAIIGQGRFGTLLQQHLQTDQAVQVFDQADDKTAVTQAELVIFAVPNRQLEQVITEVKPFVSAEAMVMDVGSVKVVPCQLLQQHFSQNVLGTHPLFGPDSARDSWQGHKVVFCRLQIGDANYTRVQQLFTSRGVTIFECTPEEHDTMMAKTQALVHYIGRALTGLQPQDISTPDYANLLRMMEKVTNDTYELFYDMQTLNPFARPARHDFLSKLQTLEYDIVTHAAVPLTLPELRDQIDQIDEAMVALIGQRLALARQVGELKQAEQTTVQDPRRETEIFLRLNTLAQRYQVPLEVAVHLYDFLLAESRRLQK